MGARGCLFSHPDPPPQTRAHALALSAEKKARKESKVAKKDAERRRLEAEAGQRHAGEEAAAESLRAAAEQELLDQKAQVRWRVG